MKFHHFYSHWINFWLLLEQSTIGPFMEKILLTPVHMTKALGAEEQKSVFNIVAGGRCEGALLKRICRDTVTKTLECALVKHSDINTKNRKSIVELNKICPNNVATQCDDQLYTNKTE